MAERPAAALTWVQTYRHQVRADDTTEIVGATAHGCRAEIRVDGDIAVYAQGVVRPDAVGVRLVADGRTIAEDYRRNGG